MFPTPHAHREEPEMTTQIDEWATTAAHEAAELLGLDASAVERVTLDDGSEGIGLRLEDGRLACIPVRSSYPRPKLLRLARRMLKAG